jgi:glutaredoxin
MKATIYSKPSCPFCDQAKLLLERTDFETEEVIVDVGQQRVAGQRYISADELKALDPTIRSVPQVFIEGQRVGGFNELKRYLSKAA